MAPKPLISLGKGGVGVPYRREREISSSRCVTASAAPPRVSAGAGSEREGRKGGGSRSGASPLRGSQGRGFQAGDPKRGLSTNYIYK